AESCASSSTTGNPDPAEGADNLAEWRSNGCREAGRGVCRLFMQGGRLLYLRRSAARRFGLERGPVAPAAIRPVLAMQGFLWPLTGYIRKSGVVRTPPAQGEPGRRQLAFEHVRQHYVAGGQHFALRRAQQRQAFAYPGRDVLFLQDVPERVRMVAP